jgi:transposase
MRSKRQKKNKIYSAEFKLEVVTDIHHNYLSFPEVRQKYFPYAKSPKNLKFVNKWIEIYKTEGATGLMTERRGNVRKTKQAISKESNDNEITTMKDLLKENERLRVENEYLKKLDALIQKKEKNQKSK